MVIEIWSVGKANEAHLDSAIVHYLQKVKPWCTTELVIIPPPKKGVQPTPEATLAAEEAIILKKLGPQHQLILLDERGKTLDIARLGAIFSKSNE